MLEWIDDRWHLDGKPIHAGCGMEFRWPDGTWEAVRIESSDAGRRLYAHFGYHGECLAVMVCNRGQDFISRDVRWPQCRGATS